MGCPCNKPRRRMAGKPVKAAGKTAPARAITAASAVSSGQWATSCEPGTPIKSLLKAQRAARACGGRVVPS